MNIFAAIEVSLGLFAAAPGWLQNVWLSSRSRCPNALVACVWVLVICHIAARFSGKACGATTIFDPSSRQHRMIGAKN